MAAKLSKVAQAYERCKVARSALTDAGGACMEVTEDKAGILWERWVMPGGVSLILFATPTWFDVYAPLTNSNKMHDVVARIAAVAAIGHMVGESVADDMFGLVATLTAMRDAPAGLSADWYESKAREALAKVGAP